MAWQVGPGPQLPDELYSYRQVRGVVLHSYWQAGGVLLRQGRLHAVYAVQGLSTV